MRTTRFASLVVTASLASSLAACGDDPMTVVDPPARGAPPRNGESVAPKHTGGLDLVDIHELRIRPRAGEWQRRIDVPRAKQVHPAGRLVVQSYAGAFPELAFDPDTGLKERRQAEIVGHANCTRGDAGKRGITRTGQHDHAPVGR